MRIHENIAVVGSGDSGFNLSDPGDCTVYLIQTPEECALIDAGAGRDAGRILENIEREGIDPQKITKIFLTHGHGDHAGGAAGLSRRLHAQVYALEETAEFVSAGDELRTSVAPARESGMYDADFHLQACPVKALQDGEYTEIGGLALETVRTDGHCAGHASYVLSLADGKKAVFSGDSVLYGGQIMLQAIWDCDLQKYLESCRKLEQIHADLYLPAHGLFSLERGWRHAEKAAEHIQRLELP